MLGQLDVRAAAWRTGTHGLRSEAGAGGEHRSVLAAFLWRDEGVDGCLSLGLDFFLAHACEQAFDHFDSSLESFEALFHHAESLVAAGLVVVNHDLPCVFIQRYFMLLF